MKTFILPGFSEKNKEWADECQKHLTTGTSEMIVWKHWKSGNTSDFSDTDEAFGIIAKIGQKKFNILAKSIGTLVACRVLTQKISLVGKIVFCGIPLLDINEEEKNVYNILKNVQPHKIICIQNQNDNHGSFAQVKKFLANINPEIGLESKPREDHNYPYFEEIEDFLRH